MTSHQFPIDGVRYHIKAFNLPCSYNKYILIQRIISCLLSFFGNPKFFQLLINDLLLWNFKIKIAKFSSRTIGCYRHSLIKKIKA